MASGGDSSRAIFYALGANFAIFVAKGFAAFMTGSSAMLAEAVHSLADCGNQGLLLLNPPWKLDAELASTLPALVKAMGEPGASHRLEWIKQEALA